MKIIFNNSKCIIRVVGDVPEEIQHVTCGIVPHLMDEQYIAGFLFLNLAGPNDLTSDPADFFVGQFSTAVNPTISIEGLKGARCDKLYVKELIHALLCYKTTQMAFNGTGRDLEIIAEQLATQYGLYE